MTTLGYKLDDIWDDLRNLQFKSSFPGELNTEIVSCGLISFDRTASDTFFDLYERTKVTTLNIEKNNDDEKVVIVLYGNQEVTKREKTRLISLLGTNQLLFPIIIFTDSFYQILSYEIWGYGQQVRILQKTVEFPVLPLKTGMITERQQYFQEILLLIECICRLKNCNDKLEEFYQEFKVKTEALLKAAISSERPSEKMLYKHFFERLNNKAKEIKTIQFKIERKQSEIRSLVENESKLIKRDAVSEVIEIKGNSSAVNELGFEFIQMAQFLTHFFGKIEEDNMMGSIFIKKLEAIKGYLKFATDISILGMFSSGKTTFINSLLGTELGTSSGHNTAVLTSLEYVRDDEDFPTLELNYQDRIFFELLRVGQNDQDLALESPCNGRLKSLFSANGQNILTIIDEDNGDKIRPLVLGNRKLKKKYFRFGPDSGILNQKTRIKFGDILTEGFSKKDYREKENSLKSFKKKEIRILSELIRKGAVSAPILTIFKIGDESEKIKSPNVIAHFLDKIDQWLGEDEENDELFFERLNIPSNSVFHKIWQANLSFEINNDSADFIHMFKLDEEGWQKLSNQNGRKGFLESPECYLFVNESRIFLKDDLLKLANIIDTPGIGSITDRHDEIAEKQLRESEGILIIMIPLHGQTEKYEFWTLLGLLHCIFTHRNRPTDQIIFLCNWFSNAFGKKTSEGIKAVEGVKRSLAEFGFTNPNLFVCDLHSLLKPKEGGSIPEEEKESFHGFPSMKAFKKVLRRKIKAYGPGNKLRLLQEEMDQLIENQEFEDKKLLEELKRAETKKQQIINDLRKQQGIIESVHPNKEVQKNDLGALSQATSTCYSLTSNVNKGNEWGYAKQRIVEQANRINDKFEKPDGFVA